MNRLFILLVALLLVGCEAHLVTKELYIADPQPPGESRCIPPKIFPIEISNKKRTNSIFWIPLIPAPWHDREYVKKIRIEVAYEPAAKECSADEVYLVSDGIEYSPEMAYLFEFRGEVTRCIYKFNISSPDVGRSNSVLKLNRGGSCGVVEQSLVYKKKTVYENHFQPW